MRIVAVRIAPSLVVMSLVTAVPFGLAIRDEVSAKPRREVEASRFSIQIGRPSWQ